MKSFIFFIAGAAVGAVGSFFVTKYICQAKAEAKIAKESAEARNFYKDKYKKNTEKIDEEVRQKSYANLTKPYLSDSDRIFGSKYDIFGKDETVTVNKIDDNPNVYMIDPDDAGMDDAYKQYELDYYQDGNLVDQEGNIVEDQFEIAGGYLDDLSLENPEIFVRNDVTKTEYDICYIAACYEQPGGVYD